MSNYRKLPDGCSVPNPQGVIALLREFGLSGLGGCDGCLCAHFAVLGVSVDLSCHKSEFTLRVHSGCLGFSQVRLVDVAVECWRQIADGRDAEYADRYRIRFCEYRYDHATGSGWTGGVWVDKYACCYCGAERDRDAYLCVKCCLPNQESSALDAYPLDLSERVNTAIQIERLRMSETDGTH